MPRCPRLPITCTLALAALAFVASASAQPADCVTGLSLCALECDQQTKPGNPDRPQCARTCVSNYQRCARLELLQLNTVPPTKGVLAPQ